MKGDKFELRNTITSFILLIFISGAVFCLANPSGMVGDLRENTCLRISQAWLEVDGNSDFSGFPGNGTKFNPYRIESLSVNGSDLYGIYIQNTDSYFTIRNCSFRGFTWAIYLRNVTHGCISNNSIISPTCIRFANAHQITIQNNTLGDHGLGGTYGIFFNGCDNNTITLNKVINQMKHMLLGDSHHNNITHNNISLAGDCGIDLIMSNYNSILDNTFNCTTPPWREDYCTGNIFEGNVIIPCPSTIPSFGFLILFPLLVSILIGWILYTKISVRIHGRVS